MGGKWQASAANVAGRGLSGGLDRQRPQALRYRALGLRELHQILIQAAHLIQDELGLGSVQFTDIESNHIAATIREYREGEYRRCDAERGGSIQGVLVADQERVVDLEAVGKFQHFVASV